MNRLTGSLIKKVTLCMTALAATTLFGTSQINAETHVSKSSVAISSPAATSPSTRKLENGYIAITRKLTWTKQTFAHVEKRVTNLKAYIEAQQKKGNNVDVLLKALDAFNTSINEAQAPFNDAVKTMQQHGGFDGKGRVTNEKEAQATLDAANASLKKSDEIRYAAEITLSKVIVEYRLSHK